MKPVLAAVFAIIALAFDARSAYSDVNVHPDPRDRHVVLDGMRLDRGHFVGRQNSRSAISKPRPRPRMDCRTDPVLLKYGCRTYLQTDPAGAVLTEGDVLRAVREIGLPSLQVQLQPGTSTLVNVPTIFYTRPEAFRRSVTLLGFNVDLIADPVRYRWLHGDGTATTTTRPGKPYPSTEVTYRYRQPAEAINPRVDVTYRVRYRVDGGAWNTINQTLLASGPTTDLEVKEAAPVLTHP